jgi:rhodanese-related sulfurtransferase
VTLSAIEADQDVVKKKDRLVLTVCDNGTSSGKAANRLRKAGYDKVFSLQGGLNGWRAQNLPLVK